MVRNSVVEPRQFGRKVDLPFSPEEADRFRAFLENTGRKAGPWLRILAIQAMEREESRGDGSGQARELSAFMRGAGVCPALGAIEAMAEGQP